jgi:hypothetical protein
MTRHVFDKGVSVVEVDRPNCQQRRRRASPIGSTRWKQLERP